MGRFGGLAPPVRGATDCRFSGFRELPRPCSTCRRTHRAGRRQAHRRWKRQIDVVENGRPRRACCASSTPFRSSRASWPASTKAPRYRVLRPGHARTCSAASCGCFRRCGTITSSDMMDSLNADRPRRPIRELGVISAAAGHMRYEKESYAAASIYTHITPAFCVARRLRQQGRRAPILPWPSPKMLKLPGANPTS